jgi:hypothetical protein
MTLARRGDALDLGGSMKVDVSRRVTACLLLVLVAACGGGGEDPAPVTPPAEDNTVPSQPGGTPRNLGIVIQSVSDLRLTAATTPYALSGQVLAFDGLGLPPQLDWEVTSAQGTQRGATTIGSDGAWQTSVPLASGDNVIRLASSDAEETLVVTYNAQYAFGGRLAVYPDVLYVGEPRTLTATIALTSPMTDPDDAILVQTYADGSSVILGSLTDDGDLSNGDEIEGDSIYSCRVVSYVAPGSGMQGLRARVGLSGGGLAQSETFLALASDHLTDQGLMSISTKQAQIQQDLDQAEAEGRLPAAVDAAVAALASDPTVAQVGESADGLGVWTIYTSGVAGVIRNVGLTTKGGSERGVAAPPGPPRVVDYPPYAAYETPSGSTHGATAWSSPAAAGDNAVGSNRAFVLAAQYFDWGEGDDIPAMAQILEDSCFNLTYKRYTSSGSGSVEDFKGLGSYGVICISSHGDSFYSGLLNLWKETFGWNGPFGQVVVHSNMTVTTANKVTYEDDLKKGRLVVWSSAAGTHYGVMPGFVSTYAGGNFPNSLVYMSICRGAWNGTMAQAFLGRGAGTFLGYDDYVSVQFCQETGPALLNTLLVPGNDMGDAFTPGRTDPYGEEHAEFKLFGSNDLSLDTSGVQDGSLESGSIGQAWQIDGDARAITSLGAASPTDGTYMAVISTGLGFTTSSGSMSQEFCLGSEDATISFDWNYFSEEFLEFCGSQFQDAFVVTLTDAEDAANQVVLLNRKVDDLCGEVSAVSNSFDQGDVYATGWRGFSQAIPGSLVGKRVILKFYATDVGDSIYDTAILIDDIRITPTPMPKPSGR